MLVQGHMKQMAVCLEKKVGLVFTSVRATGRFFRCFLAFSGIARSALLQPEEARMLSEVREAINSRPEFFNIFLENCLKD